MLPCDTEVEKYHLLHFYALITPKPPLPQMGHILSVGGTNVMPRNLGHARAVDAARLSKSESHNASRLRDFTKKTDLKSRLPPFSSP